jgi:hypothetical protein
MRTFLCNARTRAYSIAVRVHAWWYCGPHRDAQGDSPKPALLCFECSRDTCECWPRAPFTGLPYDPDSEED